MIDWLLLGSNWMWIHANLCYLVTSGSKFLSAVGFDKTVILFLSKIFLVEENFKLSWQMAQDYIFEDYSDDEENASPPPRPVSPPVVLPTLQPAIPIPQVHPRHQMQRQPDQDGDYNVPIRRSTRIRRPPVRFPDHSRTAGSNNNSRNRMQQRQSTRRARNKRRSLLRRRRYWLRNQ